MTASEDTAGLIQTMSSYKREASWAVWETDSDGLLTGEMAFPLDQTAGLVHGRAMIVSLNPATGRYDDPAVPDWANFHSSLRKHNDRFLAAAFIDTEFWGAYMADLHPTIAESDSRLVKLDAAGVRSAVDSLIEQARSLGAVRTVVGVGNIAFKGVAKHLELIKQELGAPDLTVVGIPHYSGQASRVHSSKADVYRAIVHERLGLKP